MTTPSLRPSTQRIECSGGNPITRRAYPPLFTVEVENKEEYKIKLPSCAIAQEGSFVKEKPLADGE